MKVEFTAGPDDAGRRLETVIRRLLPQLGLGGIHKALRSGDVRLNGARATADSRVEAGDVLAVWDRLVASPPPPPATASFAHRWQDSWLLHEGPDWVILNKPSGLLVQGGTRDDPSLDELVRWWLSPRQPQGLSFRSGPLHRLDRPTSGVLVFSASLNGARSFSAELAAGRVKKTYWALLQGRLERPLVVDVALTRDEQRLTTHADAGGKPATTTFLPLESTPKATWARVELEHGRTHQIRAHASEAGYPLWGDTKYGAQALSGDAPRPWILHARRLECALFPVQLAPLDDATQSFLQKTFKLMGDGTDQLA